MIIEDTGECGEFTIVADINADLRQLGDWIQMDEHQARKLIEVLQKWLDGEVIE